MRESRIINIDTNNNGSPHFSASTHHHHHHQRHRPPAPGCRHQNLQKNVLNVCFTSVFLKNLEKTRISRYFSYIASPISSLLCVNYDTILTNYKYNKPKLVSLIGYQKEKKTSILIASHNMAEVERLCSFVIMMNKGNIIDKGKPEELIKKHGRKNLEDTFLKIARSENELV